MNKVTLIGRLTKDPEVRHNDNTVLATYTLAVDRKFKNEGQPTADFIRIKAWNKVADFIEKYLHKGTKIAVIGRIETGSYKDKDGKTIYTTEVVAEEHEFCESKKEAEESENAFDGFTPIPDGLTDEELPFA